MRISFRIENIPAQRFQRHPAMGGLTIAADHGWTERTVTVPDQ